ncbi:MAG: hypothetical protein EA397_00670, partial [Deltaproteobacteria bacterium]
MSIVWETEGHYRSHRCRSFVAWGILLRMFGGVHQNGSTPALGVRDVQKASVATSQSLSVRTNEITGLSLAFILGVGYSEAMALLHGRYQLLQPLGDGGAGQTWLALDTHTGAQVTVKELRADLRGQGRGVVEREARLLGQLDHPQIPRFVEAFVEDVRLVPRLHLVLEYVEGASLADHVAQRRPSQDQVRTIMEGLLGILAWLHERSPPVIHRDIKPQNLIVRPDGRLVLIVSHPTRPPQFRLAQRRRW